jgi:hypothetical protein
LLIEEQRTNFALNSGAITGSTGTSVTTDATIAPDGSLTADLITETEITGEHYAGDRIISVTAGVNYTWSTFIKDGPSANRLLYLRVATAANITLQFNPRAKTITAASGTGAIGSGFESLPNGWFRVWMTFTAQTTGTLVCRLQLWSTTAIYLGVLDSGLYLWGAQLEAGAFPTSYIPTVASQVTRSVDVAVMTGTNFSSWYNASEGTIYSEANRFSNSSSTLIWSLDNGTPNNRQSFVFSSATQLRYRSITNATMDVSIDQTILSAPAYLKGAGTYKVNDFAFSTNGLTVGTDTVALVPSVNSLSIGSQIAASGGFLNGTIKRIAYYPRRLANSELQAITR